MKKFLVLHPCSWKNIKGQSAWIICCVSHGSFVFPEDSVLVQIFSRVSAGKTLTVLSRTADSVMVRMPHGLKVERELFRRELENSLGYHELMGLS